LIKKRVVARIAANPSITGKGSTEQSNRRESGKKEINFFKSEKSRDNVNCSGFFYAHIQRNKIE